MTKYESELEEARRKMYDLAQDYSNAWTAENDAAEALAAASRLRANIKRAYLMWAEEVQRLALDPLNLDGAE
jgi:hypothetical protein